MQGVPSNPNEEGGASSRPLALQQKGGTSGQTEESQLHFLDYWRIIRLRKIFIFAIFLLVLGTTALYTYWRPKQYASTVSMVVEKDATDIPNLVGQQYQGQYDPWFLETQVQRLQSKEVLYPVIEALQLNTRWAKRYGVSQLQTPETFQILSLQRMQVRPARTSSIIEVKVFAEEPQEASDIANKIAEEYKRIRIEQILDLSSGGIAKYKEERDDYENKVKKQQAVVDKLREDLRIIDTSTEGGAASRIEPDALRRLDAQRIDAQVEYVNLNTKLIELKRLDPVSLRNAIQGVQYNERLAYLLKTQDDYEQQLATKLKDYSEDHPQVLRAKALLAQINQQVEENVKGAMESLAINVKSLKAKLEELDKKVEDAKREDTLVANKNRPYEDAKTELESLQMLLKSLTMKISQETVDSKLPHTSIVKIINPAEPSLKPVSPIVSLNLSVGAVVGLILGIGLAFFIEYLDTSVKTIDDIERILQAPVVGVIPQNIGLLYKEGLDSPHAEAYRVLRTNLLFARKSPEANTITMVSAGAGEGKSTTILNLATVFAQNGHRVLLIDSDLRRPSLHKQLGVSNSIGLTSLLLGQQPLEDVIMHTSVEHLDFIPSGRLPSSSIGILSSPQMREFIEEIKKQYDFVFFDAPPILGVSDASILASAVDAVLLVVQYRKYPQAMTMRAKQTVEKVGGNLIGVVLNNISISQDSNYYYGGYNYAHYGMSDDARVDGEKPSDKDRKPPALLKQKY